MKNYFLILASILLFNACTNNSHEPEKETKDSNVTETPVKMDTTNTQQTAKEYSQDTIIYAKFDANKTAQLKGYLQANGPKVTCRFSIDKPSRLTATVIPVKEGCNIRFTNIVFPDNKMDGPFGKAISYKLSLKGEYQLVLGHNQMSGDPEACDFVLKIKLD